jgi:hypothetical protein
MAGFRIGSLASLLVFGCASTAVAQFPNFSKTSEIINDNGGGVRYAPNTSYTGGIGAFGFNYICCPSNYGGLHTGVVGCEFGVKPTGSDNPADALSVDVVPVQPGAASPVLIVSNGSLTFTGPSQWTVTLVAHCYYQKDGHYYLPHDFTTSYSLDVEKPNQN